MKRTQLYMEDDIFRVLKRLGKEKSVSISELVREAVRKIYGAEKPADAEFILKEAAGVWKNRQDIKSSESYVRKMRKDTRRERYGLN